MSVLQCAAVRYCQHPPRGDVQRQDLQAVAPVCCLQSGGAVRGRERRSQRANPTAEVSATGAELAIISKLFSGPAAGLSEWHVFLLR